MICTVRPVTYDMCMYDVCMYIIHMTCDMHMFTPACTHPQYNMFPCTRAPQTFGVACGRCVTCYSLCNCARTHASRFACACGYC